MQTQTHSGPSPTSPPLDPAFVAFMDDYLRKALREQIEEKLEQFVRQNELRTREFSLLERMVRVEEELKALRETEAVHYTSLLREMTARFEAVDKRFNVVLWAMGLGFTATFALLAALIGFATKLVQ
jgi:hypothetical protein